MDAKTGFFYFFSAVLLYSALRVITSRNPVHAVLHLILGFSQAAAIWLLLKAEFLGIMLVVVYMGAVMVLFLFVVMMINLNMEGLRQGFWRHFPLAAVIGVVIALEMSYVLIGGFREPVKAASLVVPPVGAADSNTMQLGTLLYTQYLYPLEIAAVILLVAIIAAIALTLRRRKDSRSIDPSQQVNVRARDRMQVVKLPATQPAVAPARPAPAEEAKP